MLNLKHKIFNNLRHWKYCNSKILTTANNPSSCAFAFNKANSYYFCTTTDNPKANKFRILFFGNDEVSLPSLEKLYEYSLKNDSLIDKITTVTTPSENKKSTQAIFHKFLTLKNCDKILLDKKDLTNSWLNLQNKIIAEKYNLGLIASFGLMIPKDVIASLNEQVFVMHPSLLPKYRGGAPIQHTLLNKEKVTGITLCQASIGKFDAGDIVIKKKVDIEVFHRFKELSFILSNLGADTIIEFLSNYEHFLANKFPQDQALASKAPIIKGEEIYLDFANYDANKILTEYRAFFGSQIEPFTKFTLKQEQRQMFFENLLLVTKTSSLYTKVLKEIDSKAKPGSIYWDLKQEKNFIFIKAKDDWLASNKVKLNGTNYLDANYVITKLLLNKRFDEVNKSEINFKTLPDPGLQQKKIDNK